MPGDHRPIRRRAINQNGLAVMLIEAMIKHPTRGNEFRGALQALYRRWAPLVRALDHRYGPPPSDDRSGWDTMAMWRLPRPSRPITSEEHAAIHAAADRAAKRALSAADLDLHSHAGIYLYSRAYREAHDRTVTRLGIRRSRMRRRVWVRRYFEAVETFAADWRLAAPWVAPAIIFSHWLHAPANTPPRGYSLFTMSMDAWSGAAMTVTVELGKTFILTWHGDGNPSEEMLSELSGLLDRALTYRERRQASAQITAQVQKQRGRLAARGWEASPSGKVTDAAVWTARRLLTGESIEDIAIDVERDYEQVATALRRFMKLLALEPPRARPKYYVRR